MEGAGGREARRRAEAWLVAALEGRGRRAVAAHRRRGEGAAVNYCDGESLDCRNTQAELFGLGSTGLALEDESNHSCIKKLNNQSPNIHSMRDATHTPLQTRM